MLYNKCCWPWTYHSPSWPSCSSLCNVHLLQTNTYSSYWHDLTRRTTLLTRANWVRKLWIPYWVLFAIFLGLEIATGFIRAYGFNVEYFLYIEGAYYLLASLSTSIYFIVCGYYVITGLRRSVKLSQSGRTQRVMTSTYFIMASIIGLVGMMILIILIGVTNLLFAHPWNFILLWAFMNYSQQIVAVMLIAAFFVPAWAQKSESRAWGSRSEHGSKGWSLGAWFCRQLSRLNRVNSLFHY